MRSLDNMDLVDSAVRAVLEPKQEGNDIKALTDLVKSMMSTIASLRTRITVLESSVDHWIHATVRPGTANSDINTLHPKYLEQMQQYKMQQQIQPTINWDAVFGENNVNTQLFLKG